MANDIESDAESEIVNFMDEKIRVPRCVIADGRRRQFFQNEKKKIKCRKDPAYADNQRASIANSMRKRRHEPEFRKNEVEKNKEYKQKKREEARANGDDAIAPTFRLTHLDYRRMQVSIFCRDFVY